MTRINQSPLSLTLTGLIQTGAAFTVLFSSLSLFDSQHRYFELLSHFKLQYFLILLITVIIFTLLKKYIFAVILFSSALVNLTFIVPWYLTNDTHKNSSHSDVELKLLHSNVLSSNDQFDQFINMIHREKPDVFVMQEVNQRWLSHMDVLKKTYPYDLSLPREDNFGMALFSKYPFQSIKQINFGTLELPSILADISVDDKIVAIIASHPVPPIGQGYYQARNQQITGIAELSQNINTPLIVIGDLNVSMWSHDYHVLEENTDLYNAREGFGLLPTWPTQLLPFMIPIDHCLVSSDFVVKAIKTGQNIGSDHLPLVVTLGLKT